MSGPKVKPDIIAMKSWNTGPDTIAPGAEITMMASVEGIWTTGMYFMPPGVKTTVFSMHDADDGTADEYYGPCYEFYYILVGEFTMYWGEDAAEVRESTSNKLHLKAGELGHWPMGWNYSVANTGNMPGTFFWGLTSPPKGTKTRPIYSDYTAQNPTWQR